VADCADPAEPFLPFTPGILTGGQAAATALCEI
jgi:hypothetical protein